MPAFATRVRLLAVMSAVSASTASLGLHAAETTPPGASDGQTTLRKITVSDSDTGPYTVESSDSATPLSLSLRDTPQSLTVVTRAQLDDRNMQSLRDVLDNTPGVYSYAYDTERVLFTARGFVVDNLMYDGVPAVTNTNTDSVDETLDTALYERIEIVRGATGLMTGAGSPAASVNLVRKHADARTFTADVSATMGRWNDQRYEADLSAPLTADGRVRVRAVGVYQDRDSYQALYSNQRKVFYGVLDADLSDDALLSFGFDYQDNAPRGNTWGSFPLFLGDGTPANWPRSVTTATDWSFWDRSKQTAFSELRYALGNDWSLRASLTWRRYKEDLALFYVFGFPDPQSGEGLDEYANRSSGEVTERSIDVHASGPFSAFGRQHELVLGYFRQRADKDAREFGHDEPLPDTGNFFNWDGSYPRPQFDGEGFLVSALDTWQNGVYAAGRLALADPLKLIAGLRYTTWKSQGVYIYAADDSNFDYRKIIPYGGVIWDVSEQFSAFASYTGIFKPQGSRTVTGALLDPIQGRSYEVGVKGEHFDGRVNTALTLFQTDQSNVATAVFDPETGEAIRLPNGTQASRPIDGTETRGFEMEVAGELRAGWNASLGWSRYLIDDADGRAVRTFVPRTLVRGFTSWTPEAVEKLTLGGGISWQSRSKTTVAAPDGATTLPQESVTLLSLMARYQITPTVCVQFNSDNLLDQKYFVLDEFDNTYHGTPVDYALSINVKL
ncbi:MAG: TonB-dependent siderophore receptor [Pseudomonadota bacterium]|nr:TonB-dependent siderophore receptor [Pseudomonadota bacterium]